MYTDSVLQEMHDIKDANAKRYDNDVHALAKALRASEATRDWEVVSHTEEPAPSNVNSDDSKAKRA